MSIKRIHLSVGKIHNILDYGGIEALDNVLKLYEVYTGDDMSVFQIVSIMKTDMCNTKKLLEIRKLVDV